ncbi:conserved hypothetical protein [Ricinus communis]|uniref:3'-5' exonuclease domain-containing protein n=1 Tax=Ricinus communis TaxID=3988 RepID=B9SB50_RICCO|nr:conserved hypothetical protein [Ricinus communis]
MGVTIEELHGRVRTTVTCSRAVADRWIQEHLEAPCHHYQNIVSFDIEWRLTFQYCIRKCCPTFQLYQALANPNIIYTRVRISGNAKKLEKDYDLEVTHMANVADLAAKALI